MSKRAGAKKKQQGGKKSTPEDLDQFLAEFQKADERKMKSKQQEKKKEEKQQQQQQGKNEFSKLKWKNKREMDNLITANKERKNWPAEQTTPEPTVPVVKMYITPEEMKKKLQAEKEKAESANGEEVKKKKKKQREMVFPPIDGEIVELENIDREKEKQKELAQKAFQEELWKARMAAQVHKTTRKWLQSWVKPGMGMQYICETTENKIRELLCADGLDAGIGFPMGCSLNNVAAHYTPNHGDPTLLGKDDVVKFDIGVHYQGRIVDSAFTMCWNPQYQPLLDAARAATNAGVKAAGIDVRLMDVGEQIQEVMESYEVDINGKTFQVKCVDNLCGHNILPYRIHGGKSVPIVKINPRDHYHFQEYSKKMEEFEFFAVETFASTGKGHIHEEGECSHYSLNPDSMTPLSSLSQRERDLFNLITKQFGTLPFARRYIDRLNPDPKYILALRSLVKKGLITDYPPLVDAANCYTSQFEHTFALRPTAKEVFSRSDDY